MIDGSDGLGKYEKSMKKKVLFYSSVRDKKLFEITGFYSTDINILKELGYHVILSNSVINSFFFWKYDYVFIYFYKKGLLPAFIGQLFLKKVMFTGGIDGIDENFNKSAINLFIRKVFFILCNIFSDANIIVSSSDLDNINKLNYRARNLHLIHHAIDFERYQYCGQTKENLMTTIVWMESKGNVIRKGVDRLLHVFKELKNNKYKLIIIGTIGEGTEYLKQIGERLGILEDIVFTGRIGEDEKISYLMRSKYYFQLSSYEGFGVASIEALAAGNIVIHSNKGGLKDAIGEHGIIIDNLEHYENIAKTVHEIDKEYSKYEALIRKGIEHVKKNFSYGVRKDGFQKVINSF